MRFKLIGTKDGAKPETWLMRDEAEAKRWKAQLEAKGWFTVLAVEMAS